MHYSDQKAVTHVNALFLCSSTKLHNAAIQKSGFHICERVCSGEEEAMDHQVSPEPENGQSEEEEETSDLENGSKDEVKRSLPAKLFTFSIVNSYGTANISSLPCDGNVLKLNCQC